MANGNTTASRSGQINLAGADDALFLKVFSGEVLTTFEETNVMKNFVQMRTIPYGKSAQFPVLGRASAFYHSVGVNIMDAGNAMLNTIAANERLINVDNLLVAPVVVSDWDDMVNHYDVRGPYATQLGRALAKQFDQLAIHTAILAARASATITGLFGGSVITDAAMHTSGSALAAALFGAAQKFREKDVPMEDLIAVVSPAMYYNLIKDPLTARIETAAGTGIASSGFPQFGAVDGSNGSYGKGNIYQIGGIRLVVSNHIPSTNITSGHATFGTGATGASNRGNVYYGDFTKTKGVVLHKSAIGVLKLKDVSLQAQYKLEVQGTLTIARLATGMGILRPEAAVELAIP